VRAAGDPGGRVVSSRRLTVLVALSEESQETVSAGVEEACAYATGAIETKPASVRPDLTASVQGRAITGGGLAP
jgi:hypothetical protein